MMQSRSISPNRSPPSRARPSTGCRVRICTGPRPLRQESSVCVCGGGVCVGGGQGSRESNLP
jgi:hypothetical protein